MVVFTNVKESKLKQMMTLYENYVLLTFRALALRQSKRIESEPGNALAAIYVYSYTTIIDHLERETFFRPGAWG